MGGVRAAVLYASVERRGGVDLHLEVRIAALERELSALKAESHQGLGPVPRLDDPQAAHNRPEGMIGSAQPGFHGMYYWI